MFHYLVDPNRVMNNMETYLKGKDSSKEVTSHSKLITPDESQSYIIDTNVVTNIISSFRSSDKNIGLEAFRAKRRTKKSYNPTKMIHTSNHG